MFSNLNSTGHTAETTPDNLPADIMSEHGSAPAAESPSEPVALADGLPDLSEDIPADIASGSNANQVASAVAKAVAEKERQEEIQAEQPEDPEEDLDEIATLIKQLYDGNPIPITDDYYIAPTSRTEWQIVQYANGDLTPVAEARIGQLTPVLTQTISEEALSRFVEKIREMAAERNGTPVTPQEIAHTPTSAPKPTTQEQTSQVNESEGDGTSGGIKISIDDRAAPHFRIEDQGDVVRGDPLPPNAQLQHPPQHAQTAMPQGAPAAQAPSKVLAQTYHSQAPIGQIAGDMLGSAARAIGANTAGFFGGLWKGVTRSNKAETILAQPQAIEPGIGNELARNQQLRRESVSPTTSTADLTTQAEQAIKAISSAEPVVAAPATNSISDGKQISDQDIRLLSESAKSLRSHIDAFHATPEMQDAQKILEDIRGKYGDKIAEGVASKPVGEYKRKLEEAADANPDKIAAIEQAATNYHDLSEQLKPKLSGYDPELEEAETTKRKLKGIEAANTSAAESLKKMNGMGGMLSNAMDKLKEATSTIGNGLKSMLSAVAEFVSGMFRKPGATATAEAVAP